MYISGNSSGNYLTGMTSGLDVDAMVKELMDAERVSYDKLDQKKQYYAWEIDAYQNQLSSIGDFQSEFLNYTNEQSNLLSASTYLSYTCDSSHDAVYASVVDGDLANSSYTIEVLSLATASFSESNKVSSDIEGSVPVDYGILENQSITMTLDGNEQTFIVEDYDNNGSITLLDLQNLINDAFGENKIEITENAGCLKLNTVANSGVHALSISGDESILQALGFTESDHLSNRINLTMSLDELSSEIPFSFDVDGMLTFSINGEHFEFNGETTVEEMINTINSSDAQVDMVYDDIHDTFTLESKVYGAGNQLSFEELGSSFFSTIGCQTIEEGEDAQVLIDDVLMVRNDNTITYDGIAFDIKEVTTEPMTISVVLDETNIKDKIVAFVESYNKLISSIQDTLKEERDYDYDPLTYAQRSEMSEDEIETWEENVKVGILANDSILKDMLTEMRQGLYSPVEGLGISLSDLGISSDSYETGGVLKIDLDQLDGIIESSPNEVVALMTKQSDQYPGTSSARLLDQASQEIRFEEEGLMYRLLDITEKYVADTSDNNGQKGILVEKCGYRDDYTYLNSTMNQKLEQMEDQLYDLEEKLNEKEEKYYREFSVMETYLSQMNSQMQMVQSWFA